MQIGPGPGPASESGGARPVLRLPCCPATLAWGGVPAPWPACLCSWQREEPGVHRSAPPPAPALSPLARRPSLVVRPAVAVVHVAIPDGQDVVQGDHQAQPCHHLWQAT